MTSHNILSPVLCIAAMLTTCACITMQAASPQNGTADDVWEAITKPSVVAASSVAGQKSDVKGDQALPNDVKQLLRQADRFRQFRQNYPGHTKVAEAKCQEAIALLQAGFLGDFSQEETRRRLVEEIRSDKSIAAAQRSDVTAYAENLKIVRRRDLSPGDRLAEFERVARELVAEFPEVPGGYESLLGIACSRSDIAGVEAAREFLRGSAPEPIKQQARIVIQRHALIGKSVQEVVAAVPELKSAFEQQRGHAVLLYTWSIQSLSSVVQAQKLGKEVPSDVGLIGLNLDADSIAAKAVAEQNHLKGIKCFDAHIMAGVLAMPTPGMVYAVDKRGVVISVSAHRNLVNVIKGLAAP